MVYYSDDLKDLVNQIFDTFAETKTDKTEKPETKTQTDTPKRVSKSELIEELKKEVTKQVEQAMHGVYKEIDKLDHRMSDFNKELDNITDVIDDLQCEIYGDSTDIDEESENDYDFEDMILKSIKKEFDLEGYTISDGKNAALVIPLDDDFNLKKFARNLVLKSLDNEDK